MPAKSGKTQKPRRNPHSGRARGSTIQTGNAGSRKTPLTHIEKALMTPYLDQAAARMRRRSEREKSR